MSTCSMRDYNSCCRRNEMAKTSFVDHVARTGIPDAGPKLKGVTNSEEWGARKAEERYNQGVRVFSPPEDVHAPQKLGDRSNLQDSNYTNDASGWVRAPNEDATTKPNFDPRGKDGLPKKW